MKKVLLITTGGTIASKPSDNGLVPQTDGDALVEFLGEMSKGYDITICNLLTLDSSNIQPEEWQIIARKVYESKNDYGAIVITHGTDTMAYTASVLSYMLKGISIPVVITGSQLPIHHPLTDAVINLRSAFEMANRNIGGVFVAFDRKVMLGCRVVKVRASGFNAFESINHDEIGIIDSDGLKINHSLLLESDSECSLNDELCNKVFLLKLTPGTNPDILPAIANLGCSGIVIEAYGSGGINFIRRDLVSMVENLVHKDIPVVVCTQCLYDRANLSNYEVGVRALRTGVISANDMTTEATVTKLMWGIGQYNKTDKTQTRIDYINELFDKNLVGEISK